MEQDVNQPTTVKFKCFITKKKTSDTDNTTATISLQQQKTVDIPIDQQIRLLETTYAVVPSAKNNTLMTSSDPQSAEPADILATKSLKIADLLSSSKEKILMPFWNQQSAQISKRLLLQTKTDYLHTVILSSTKSSTAIMESSWFSIEKKIAVTKILPEILFQSALVEPLKSMDLPTIELKQLSEPELKYKTMRFMLHPTKEQKKILNLFADQYRYYYNFAVDLYKKGECSHFNMRDQMRKYKYIMVNRKISKATELKRTEDRKKKKEEMAQKKKEEREQKKKKEEEIKANPQPKLKKGEKQIKKEETAEVIEEKKRKKEQQKKINAEKIAKRKIQRIDKKKIEIEKKEENKIKKQRKHRLLHYDENADEYYIPPYWKTVNDRVIRGAIHNFKANVSSALANLQACNSNKYEMQFKSKKQQKLKGYTISFEDYNFPECLKKIKSAYGYRTAAKTRQTVNLATVAEASGKRGCTYMYEKATDSYYLLYPVLVSYYPEDDIRCEAKAPSTLASEDLAAIDAGVRKFLTRYCIDGSTFTIGATANKRLTDYFLRIDQEKNPLIRNYLWKKVKNLLNDLHWKTVKYLTANYKTVIMGDIEIQSILKGNRLHPLTKRALCQYSFCRFKSRLAWKLSLCGGNFILVDESYTSKTCSHCGQLNNVGSSETYSCSKCLLVVDRDVNGAQCILVKALTLVQATLSDRLL